MSLIEHIHSGRIPMLNNDMSCCETGGCSCGCGGGCCGEE
jgi:hypothetical protein